VLTQRRLQPPEVVFPLEFLSRLLTPFDLVLLAKRLAPMNQTLHQEKAFGDAVDVQCVRHFFSRTSSSSTAGIEARIQTGALPAVGWWSSLLGVE